MQLIMITMINVEISYFKYFHINQSNMNFVLNSENSTCFYVRKRFVIHSEICLTIIKWIIPRRGFVWSEIEWKVESKLCLRFQQSQLQSPNSQLLQSQSQLSQPEQQKQQQHEESSFESSRSHIDTQQQQAIKFVQKSTASPVVELPVPSSDCFFFRSCSSFESNGCVVIADWPVRSIVSITRSFINFQYEATKDPITLRLNLE